MACFVVMQDYKKTTSDVQDLAREMASKYNMTSHGNLKANQRINQKQRKKHETHPTHTEDQETTHHTDTEDQETTHHTDTEDQEITLEHQRHSWKPNIVQSNRRIRHLSHSLDNLLLHDSPKPQDLDETESRSLNDILLFSGGKDVWRYSNITYITTNNSFDNSTMSLTSVSTYSGTDSSSFFGEGDGEGDVSYREENYIDDFTNTEFIDNGKNDVGYDSDNLFTNPNYLDKSEVYKRNQDYGDICTNNKHFNEGCLDDQNENEDSFDALSFYTKRNIRTWIIQRNANIMLMKSSSTIQERNRSGLTYLLYQSHCHSHTIRIFTKPILLTVHRVTNIPEHKYKHYQLSQLQISKKQKTQENIIINRRKNCLQTINL